MDLMDLGLCYFFLHNGPAPAGRPPGRESLALKGAGSRGGRAVISRGEDVALILELDVVSLIHLFIDYCF